MSSLQRQQSTADFFVQSTAVTDGWYKSTESKLSDVFPKWVGDIVFTMTAPKKVAIHDSVLGTVEKILWALTIAWLSYEMFTLKQYNLVGVPDGYPQFFFERGEFNTVRNYAFGYGGQNAPWPPEQDDKAYCTAFEQGDYGPYEYIKVKRDKAGNVLSPVKDESGKWVKSSNKFTGANYFNDDKVRCKQLNFAEIYKKDASTGYVTTFQKETYSKVMNCAKLKAMGSPGDCDSNGVRQAPDTVSSIIPKNNAEETGVMYFPTRESSEVTSCTCLELRNYMAIAPEFTALSFFHNYQVPPEFDNGLSGSSANEQDTKADGKHPNTYLQKKPPCPPAGCYVDIAASNLQDGGL